jgi:acyl-CoA synthetase (AMP-forming)/AMP-acid ligase II
VTAPTTDSVAACVARYARLAPHAIALIPRVGDAWTYLQLSNEVKRLANHLDRTAGSAAPLAIVMANDPESVVALLAAERSSRVAVLLPPALTHIEMTATLNAASPGLLAVPPGADPVAISGMQVIGDNSSRLHLSKLAQPFSPSLSPGSIICQLTSGSTGPSQLALRTRAAVQTEIVAVLERLKLEPQDSVLCASSIAHSYGLIGGLLAPLFVGASVILTSSAADIGTGSPDTQPTIIFGLAATYRAFLERTSAGWPGRHPTLRRVRFALSAGAPLPPGVFDEVSDRLNVEIRQDYGTTETGTIAIDAPDAPRPGWVGKPLSHMEVRLSQPQQEIQIRSVAVASGYLSGNGIVPCTSADGWYCTGDIGAMDHSGYVQVRGRLRQPILTGRGSVRPERVERAIRELPGVREVVVLPAVRDATSVTLKAVVVAPGLGMSDIRSWCADHLPLEQQPAIIELRDALPRSPAGKILQKYM